MGAFDAYAVSRRRLRESYGVPFKFREATDDGSIRGVLLIRSGPGNLADRHFYTAAALTNAVNAKIFEGAVCFIDHPTPDEEEQIPERSVSRMGGWFSDATIAPYKDAVLGECTGVYADFHPQDGREDVSSMLRTCAQYARRYPTKAYVGLSISARGDGTTATIDGEEWNRVDLISEVESVDIVTRAGAGGTFLPMRESYRMAKTATTKNRESVTVDSKKVAAGVTALRESAKSKILEVIKLLEIKEAGVSLSAEQDQALDRALGIVDGGAIDKIIDSATGVEDKEDDGVLESEAHVEEGEVEEGTSNSVVPKDLPSAIAMLKAERVKRLAAEAKVKESAKRVTVTESARDKVVRSLRESNATAIISEMGIPASHAPRLLDEIMDRPNLTESDTRAYVTNFANVYVRKDDGAGMPIRESAYTPKIDFTFEEA